VCSRRSRAASCARSSSDPVCPRPRDDGATNAPQSVSESAMRQAMPRASARCLRNTRSTTNESKCPASAKADRTAAHRTSRKAPRRTGRSLPHPAPRLAAHKMDAPVRWPTWRVRHHKSSAALRCCRLPIAMPVRRFQLNLSTHAHPDLHHGLIGLPPISTSASS